MKKLQGTVVSLKNAQTASVNVNRRYKHPLYKKYVSRDKKYACHVVDLDLNLGDQVEIVQCKPVSKTKSFKVMRKLNEKPEVKEVKEVKVQETKTKKEAVKKK